MCLLSSFAKVMERGLVPHQTKSTHQVRNIKSLLILCDFELKLLYMYVWCSTCMMALYLYMLFQWQVEGGLRVGIVTLFIKDHWMVFCLRLFFFFLNSLVGLLSL